MAASKKAMPAKKGAVPPAFLKNAKKAAPAKATKKAASKKAK